MLMRMSAGGQVGPGCLGRKFWLNRAVQGFSHGQCSGRCRVMRRAEVEILAGTLTSFRRIVAVVARARPFPAIVAAARVRLNAMTARTSQAALAVKTPEVIFSPEECMQHVRDGSYALGKRVADAVTLCCPLRQRKVIYESPTRADAKFSGRVLDGAWR